MIHEKERSPKNENPRKDTIIAYESEKKLKLVIVGDVGVGKTSIFWRYIENIFPEINDTNYEQTRITMVDFKIKNIILGSELIKLYVWDTAGQEKYRSMVSAYYKGSHGIILVCDLTDPSSLENIEHLWIKICKEKCNDAVMMILANKLDQIDQRRISPQQLKEVSERLSVPYFEVSAKTADNIEQAFTKLSLKIKKLFFPIDLDENDEQNESLQDYRQSLQNQNKASFLNNSIGQTKKKKKNVQESQTQPQSCC